jgi:hypothetical protein
MRTMKRSIYPAVSYCSSRRPPLYRKAHASRNCVSTNATGAIADAHSRYSARQSTGNGQYLRWKIWIVELGRNACNDGRFPECRYPSHKKQEYAYQAKRSGKRKKKQPAVARNLATCVRVRDSEMCTGGCGVCFSAPACGQRFRATHWMSCFTTNRQLSS